MADNSPLAQLFRIDGFGKRLMNGAHYSVKFRIPVQRAHILTNLKSRYPEMLVHFTQKDSIIFGGTFASASTFWEDCKWMLSIKKKLNHGGKN